MPKMAAERESGLVCLYVNGKKVTVRDADPETMLLSFLREKMRLTGTKYGCGGGGCGACTVMLSTYSTQTKSIHHYSVNACLMPLCQTHGAAVTTVEGIGNSKSKLHPVQERIAKANGSQCGFCTPGMVMSMYTLLRNRPQPSMEDITQALEGNLCRCTGYRPIIDGYRTFCETERCCQVNGTACCTSNTKASPEKPELFNKEEFLPLDPTQDLIFPPELIRMAESQEQTTQTFRGERMTWISPVSLSELLQLKFQYPKAPIVMGNTNIGLDIKFKGVIHPIIISATRVKELFEVTHKPEGVHVGAGCSFSTLRSVLQECVRSLPAEHTQTYTALLEQLRHLGGEQIRNVATLGGNIASAAPNSDLNPVLAAGRSSVLLLSHDGRREVPLDKDFFVGFGKTILRLEEIVLSVFIPVSRKCEVVCAFRNAPRKANALATVSAGMRVWFNHGSDVVRDMSVYYGGVGAHTLSAENTTRHVIGRSWSEATLSEAYTALLDDVTLGASAPGGKVVFRRSLTLSMFFRFYLHVLQHLREQNVIQREIPKHELSAVEPLPNFIQPGYQEFQAVSDGDCVGRPLPHCSSVSHATGEAVYCDDIPHTHGELFLSVVTSTRAHAKITHIDVGGALAMVGVVDVITANDIPGRRSISFSELDEELLAENEVTCVGHMICAVVADSKQHAKLAASALKITYEDLKDSIFTVEEAVEKSSFFPPQRELQRGDVASALQETDHVYEGEMRVGGQEHFYMETQSMLVVPVGEEKEMKVYLSIQHPTCAQVAIAETLGIPSNRVSCYVKRVGGAFGGKVTKTTVLACVTAVAAWKTGRPVRCVLERGEDMLITGGRHPVLGKYKVGFTNDGRITAADVHYYANAGNAPDESTLVAEKILLHMDNSYNIPNLRGQSAACRTNLPSNTAFRGFGVPQSMVIIENMVTDVAMTLGRPAEEIREKNMYKEVSFTHYKMEFDPENLQRCWEECKERADIAHRRENIARFNLQHRWRKRGLAIVPIKYGIAFAEGFLNQAAALVHIYKDGSVLISHGGIEMGQGLHTKVQQVASRELNIPLSLIHISETCTSSVPNTCPSAASFGTDANGMAVRDACQTLYKRLEPIRQTDPDGTWQSWIKRAFLEKISLSATGFYRGHDTGMDWEKQEGRPYAYFTYGTCCSEVELDCLSGEYRTVRTDLVVDIGKSLNPSIDIGQIEGAFTQGLGLYTMEELHFSPSGVLYTRGPAQYKIPAVCDVPLQLNVYLLSGSENPHAIYSSKGIGEPTLFLGSSVFFAIKDAVMAARKDAGLTGPFTLNSPATPERVCLACNTHFTQMIPDTGRDASQPWALQLP
ncbi:aldehyde oxidase 1 isoform X1 [Pangasianodon hypophthalmus]|uniref:aldehyde oxidase 1 isoform X1 n=1 Tax=Pangasianodon hypophthalmus TaxID=310915 RepID=UPI002307CB63|nr:aldehyde oxidase 1 isoform X1 [Pangasianodon hypophthalmus]